MFKISLDGLIVLYLAGILTVVFLSMAYAEWRRRQRERRARRNYVICVICDHVFEDDTGEELVECPRCGALNERTKILEI